MSALTGWRAGDILLLAVGIKRSKSGKPKLAVLPVPVCAAPITSLPAKTKGIA